MSGVLQRELAPVVEVLESTENRYTQAFQRAQQEEPLEDATTALPTVPAQRQDNQQSIEQQKSMQSGSSDT
jgi:hypothetical protein